jgi:hypothetical protein
MVRQSDIAKAMKFLVKINPKRYWLSPKALLLLDVKAKCFYSQFGAQYHMQNETFLLVLRDYFYFIYKTRRRPRWSRKLLYVARRCIIRPVSNVRRRLVRRIKGKRNARSA